MARPTDPSWTAILYDFAKRHVPPISFPCWIHQHGQQGHLYLKSVDMVCLIERSVNDDAFGAPDPTAI